MRVRNPVHGRNQLIILARMNPTPTDHGRRTVPTSRGSPKSVMNTRGSHTARNTIGYDTLRNRLNRPETSLSVSHEHGGPLTVFANTNSGLTGGRNTHVRVRVQPFNKQIGINERGWPNRANANQFPALGRRQSLERLWLQRDSLPVQDPGRFFRNSGYQSSFRNSPSVGINSPGVGINRPGVGFNSPGAGINSPGAGISSPGVGINSPGVGINSLVAGINSPGVGINSPGAGINSLGVGINSPVVGINSPGVGINSPVVDINSPGVGINSPGAGINSPGAGINSPGVGINSPRGAVQQQHKTDSNIFDKMNNPHEQSQSRYGNIANRNGRISNSHEPSQPRYGGSASRNRNPTVESGVGTKSGPQKLKQPHVPITAGSQTPGLARNGQKMNKVASTAVEYVSSYQTTATSLESNAQDSKSSTTTVKSGSDINISRQAVKRMIYEQLKMLAQQLNTNKQKAEVNKEAGMDAKKYKISGQPKPSTKQSKTPSKAYTDSSTSIQKTSSDPHISTSNSTANQMSDFFFHIPGQSPIKLRVPQGTKVSRILNESGTLPKLMLEAPIRGDLNPNPAASTPKQGQKRTGSRQKHKVSLKAITQVARVTTEEPPEIEPP